MKFKDVILLLPCSSLESLSLDYRGDDAEALLAVWSAPFHPAIVATTKKIPRWMNAEVPPEADALAGALVLIPNVSLSLIPETWWAVAQSTDAVVIDALVDRDRIMDAAIAGLVPEPDWLGLDAIDAELTADLLALGICQFQIELTTRRLRYMSGLDQEQFRSEAVRAATSIMRGDTTTARERIQRGFDMLTEGREYFYPTEASLLDLTLVAPTTLGQSLRQQLSDQAAANYLISGSTLADMAQREPQTLAALKTALDDNRAAIVGGEWDEPALGLLAPESILAQLRHGLASYQTHLGRRPGVFARRRFGLSPLLPGILKELGFSGACHFTLDAGRFPSGDRSKKRWEGLDGATLDALARVPMDASSGEAFVQLPDRLGRVLDLDTMATVVFAHWPGRTSRWYDDLRRMARYSPVLGRFATIDGYFEDTRGSGSTLRHAADEYHSPYLDEAVAGAEHDPISRWTRYYHRRGQCDALAALECLAAMVAGRITERPHSARFAERIDQYLAEPQVDRGDLDGQLTHAVEAALERVARALPRSDAPAEPGQLIVNPCGFGRTCAVDVVVAAAPTKDSDTADDAASGSAAVEARRRQSGRQGKRFRETVCLPVESPAMGYAWVGPRQPLSEKARARTFFRRRRPAGEPLLAQRDPQGAYVLRNEFFEATIDPLTGAIRAINDYHSRGNRLAQQLALRSPGRHPVSGGDESEDDQEQDYSVMAADEVAVAMPGPGWGRIVSRGRLVDREGRRLAGFVQTMTARRGSRVLTLDIELEPERLPDADPWNSYYAARFAWRGEMSDWFRGVGFSRVPTEASRLESPLFIDVCDARIRTTILTGGVPYHRRWGLRKLDTLLVVSGETARRFRLGIAIDAPHAAAAAVEFLAPPTVLAENVAPPSCPTGWLAHLDAPNVLATHWEPIVAQGQVEGFCVRLVETEGVATQLGLRAPHEIASAERTDFEGMTVEALPVHRDRATVNLAPNQWMQVVVKWQIQS